MMIAKNIYEKAATLSLLCAISLLTSCQLEAYDTPVEETYTREFVRQFGAIDPEQDWNMATRASVTVTTDQEDDIRIYAKSGDKYKLVADYDSVTGTQTLDFDVQRGVEDIIVAAGSHAVKTKLFEAVEFSGGG